MEDVTLFRGAFRFLSNFYPVTVVYDGHVYPSAEHAYQAAKTLILEERKDIRAAETPQKAKRMGRKVTLRKDFDQHKLTIMTEIVQDKFTRNKGLRQQLLKTDNAQLVEGNFWRDAFWGVCNGVGQNHLGKILMKVRDSLKTQEGS